MTIASSVIDVRNIDNDELFFYRVGCVPEAYVWKKLHDLKLKEKSPPLLANLNGAKKSVIQSFMSQITRLVGCESYKIHMLVETQNISHDMAATQWGDVGERTKRAFVSRVPCYDDVNSREENEGAELTSPLVNSQGEVIAVLQLFFEASSHARIKKEDLRYSALISTLVCDNLPTTRADEGVDWSHLSLVTLTESGYKRKLISDIKSGRKEFIQRASATNLIRRASTKKLLRRKSTSSLPM